MLFSPAVGIWKSSEFNRFLIKTLKNFLQTSAITQSRGLLWKIESFIVQNDPRWLWSVKEWFHIPFLIGTHLGDMKVRGFSAVLFSVWCSRRQRLETRLRLHPRSPYVTWNSNYLFWNQQLCINVCQLVKSSGKFFNELMQIQLQVSFTMFTDNLTVYEIKKGCNLLPKKQNVQQLFS